MAKPRSPRKDTGSDNEYETPLDGCVECRQKDPSARHAHYLQLARMMSLDAVAAHLREDLVQRLDDPERITASVNDITAWITRQVETYSDLADERTGQPLHWSVARKQALAEMEEVYEDQAEEGREAEVKRGGWPKAAEPWQPLAWEDLTKLRREAETVRQARREARRRRKEAGQYRYTPEADPDIEPKPDESYHDPLEYTQVTDPEWARALLRQQIRELEEQEPSHA